MMFFVNELNAKRTTQRGAYTARLDGCTLEKMGRGQIDPISVLVTSHAANLSYSLLSQHVEKAENMIDWPREMLRER